VGFAGLPSNRTTCAFIDAGGARVVPTYPLHFSVATWPSNTGRHFHQFLRDGVNEEFLGDLPSYLETVVWTVIQGVDRSAYVRLGTKRSEDPVAGK
jgi:hypothetical protein